MSKWLNNKIIIKKNLKLEKPCHDLKYCPYGQLVEEFPYGQLVEELPLHPEKRSKSLKKIKCKTFGHDCPVYYHAEGVT